MNTEQLIAYRQAIQDVNERLTYYLSRPENTEDRDGYMYVINDLTAHLYYQLLQCDEQLEHVGSVSESNESTTFEEMVEQVTGIKL